ncbi:MAG: group II intron reverse transcriptase/maturase [bacterium]
MKDISKEERPAAVAGMPKQAGEARTRERLKWVEPSVWTERMLTALEEGVKGGKWFSLMDKVYLGRNLAAAWEKVKANKGSAGIDKQSIEAFQAKEERYLEELESKLREGRYEAKPVKRVWIPKAGSKGKRPLGIPVVKDRVVQTALRNVLEPIYEKTFAEHSYGFRPGRGCKDALRRVEAGFLAGKTWVVDADIESYFDSIPHDKLMEEIKEQVADGRVLRMIEGYLKQGVMDGLEHWEPEKGTPQGAVISPLLANIYLNRIDHEMSRNGYEMVRYADDFVILCSTEEEAREALTEVSARIEERGLKLHPEKTRIVDVKAGGGFDFLGYHFEGDTRWPRKKSMDRLKDTIRGKTKRTSGKSMKCIIEDVNQSLRGWFEYFRHSNKRTFRRTDGWIRMRLRSILRKRQHRKGIGCGYDHRRWPNAYFAGLGLFTLTTAHELACQFRRGKH